MKTLRDLIAAINRLAAAIEALRPVAQQGGGGPGEEK